MPKKLYMVIAIPKTGLSFRRTSSLPPQNHNHIHNVIEILSLIVWGKLVNQFLLACALCIRSAEFQIV